MGKGRRSRWTRLDNAAKIFPCTTKNQDTKVFRFACELKEDVKEENLQKALDYFGIISRTASERRLFIWKIDRLVALFMM